MATASSGGLILQLLQVQFRRAFGEMQKFDTDHLIVLVKIQHHARRNFLGLDDFGIIQPQVKRVGFFVHMQFHSLPFIVRSKNTLTTRTGSTVVLTATRKTRPPNSGIFRKRRSTSASSGSGKVNSGAVNVRSSQSTEISRSASAFSAWLVSSYFTRRLSYNFFPVSFSYASKYFALVLATTTSGS